jgi:diadenosine tetraphosphate (Ap4A) HIT family hydrolase
VARLHWHLFPIHADDPNPTQPIREQAHAPRKLSEAEYARTVEAIRRHLG